VRRTHEKFNGSLYRQQQLPARADARVGDSCVGDAWD
jgi:hypothetical protein